METHKRKVKKPKGGGVPITQHYPWLATFDVEAKDRLLTPEIANVHVLKLITLLESNISSEVSKLRNRPNRATKLLTQIRKRVCVTKVGGYLMDTSSEKELFPTYGLLMKHIVDLTLVSSQIKKLGAERVAGELYYFLKLMFHEDNQYILDVILCSTLDEHANSKNQVGYQLFSFIVEDWRCFCTTHPGMMKYCAVASLLHTSSPAGRVFVDRNLPVDVDKTFPKYLKKTLNIDLNSQKSDSKKVTFKTVVQAIRPNSVKSICRSRLVIVSKRIINKSVVLNYDQSEESDAESTTSTVVNISSVPLGSEQPTSSTRPSMDNPMNIILGDLGMLDSVGDDELRSSSGSPDEGRVSSSDQNNHHVDLGYIKREVEEDFGDVTDDCHLETQSNVTSLIGNENESQNVLDINNGYDSDQEEEEEENEYEVINDVEAESGGYTEPDRSIDYSESLDGGSFTGLDNGNFTQHPQSSDSHNQSFENESVQSQQEVEDSDLEILSVKDADEQSNSSNLGSESSGERDEAEAESGEDFVPNYDEDSDVDPGSQSSKANSELEADNNDETLVQSEVDNEVEEATNSNSFKKSDSNGDTSAQTLETESMVVEIGTPQLPETRNANNNNNVSRSDTPQNSTSSSPSPSFSPMTEVAGSSPIGQMKNGVQVDKAQGKRKSVQQLDFTSPSKRKRGSKVDNNMSKVEVSSESEDEAQSKIAQSSTDPSSVNRTTRKSVRSSRGQGKTFNTPATSTPTTVTRRCTRSLTASAAAKGKIEQDKAKNLKDATPVAQKPGRGRGRGNARPVRGSRRK